MSLLIQDSIILFVFYITKYSESFHDMSDVVCLDLVAMHNSVRQPMISFFVNSVTSLSIPENNTGFNENQIHILNSSVKCVLCFVY